MRGFKSLRLCQRAADESPSFTALWALLLARCKALSCFGVYFVGSHTYIPTPLRRILGVYREQSGVYALPPQHLCCRLVAFRQYHEKSCVLDNYCEISELVRQILNLYTKAILRETVRMGCGKNRPPFNICFGT